jgi:REP element-mobilizing transposase RayT
MPCFLFSYHAHGTWLPDRREGFVHWRKGLQPTDQRLAAAYQRQMKLTPANFDDQVQLCLIDELQNAAGFQRLRLHAIATESTHIHVLVSWPDEREPPRLSDSLRQSASRRLNRDHAKRKWLAKGASKRRVKDQEHFDFLLNIYLPSHRGWKWDEQNGLYR